MNGRGVSRGAWPMLLGLGLLLAGLFMMHGVTATPSPLHVSEPVLVQPMAHTAHQGSPAMSMDAAPDANPAAVLGAVPGAHADIAGAAPMGLGMDMNGCIAGAICFALLTAAALVLAALAGRALDLDLIPARPGAASVLRWRRGRPPRARPPSVYQLSVLRL
ncbi:hypothetical protein [Actinomadura xylanilytica]|uniref:hypothetical protein n=1 Tax=Actinomadura xylanilytica TaxID=887459 RepID=UPI00255B2B8B|nr:hypothetical protein [Actinomadura xylanilytica]MDL4772385.1 hypothetical protein [Actinomadura xylanilytica]